LCYDAQLNSSNISSLSEYETCISEIRELSNEDNQGELPQNYGHRRGHGRGRGRGRPRGSGRGSITFL
jgi:hypothetical protein